MSDRRQAIPETTDGTGVSFSFGNLFVKSLSDMFFALLPLTRNAGFRPGNGEKAAWFAIHELTIASGREAQKILHIKNDTLFFG